MLRTIGKILVVDDEVELKSILVEALTSQGYEAAGFTAGEAALAALRVETFDVLLTDLMMPGIDGITLVREAMQIDPNVICIMMTGQGTIQTAVDAMKGGAFDYVLKPFRLQTMLPVLTRAMNTRHLRLENVQLREAVAIHELSETIAFTLDPQTVLSKLADAALQQSEADEVSVLLPTSDGTELYVAAVKGEKRERLLGERIPLVESISSWVARERMPLILNGEVSDERFVALWPRSDIRSAVSVPMQVANKLVGIINLNMTDRLRPFTLGQMKALTILAGTAAAALESASLYRKVQKAEEKYRLIFENAVEGIFQSTLDRRFLTVNPALAHILGYGSPAEVLDCFSDIGQQLFVDQLASAAVKQATAEYGSLQGFEFQAFRKDGEKIWLSLNMRVMRDQDKNQIGYEGTIEEITKRKRAEAERLAILEIIQGVSASADLDALLKLVQETIQRVVYAENCFVALYDEHTDTLDMKFFIDKYDSVPPPQKLGKSCAAYVFRTGEALLINQTLFDQLFETGAVELPGEPSPSWLGVPLKTPTKAIGVLVVQHYDDAQVYGELDREFLSSVGGQIAVAIERKLAEKTLSASEERYRHLVENAHDLIYEHDLEGNYISANRAVERLTGYTLKETLDLSLAQIVAPDDLGKAQEMIRRKFAGERITAYELAIITKDGHHVAIEVNSSLVLRDGVPVAVQGIARDITERKRVEKIRARRAVHTIFRADISASLALSRVPLRATLNSCVTAMVEHLGAAFARIWTLNHKEDLLELQASAGLYTHLDGPHARVALGSFKIGKIAKERTPHITNEVQSDPRVSDKEWARREGMVAFAGYPLLLENRVLGVMALFSRAELAEDTLDALASVADLISQGIERKRAEEGLKESEERYRLLFESNPQPMWVYDLETLAFLAVNQAAINHYGYSRDDFLAMTIMDIRPAEDIPALFDSLASAQDFDDAGIWRHRKKDGTIIEVAISSHQLVFADRQAELVLAHDITEGNRLKAALLASEGQLRQSQKLEAIGQLAGGVAHDFNNLLTAINGYSALALRRVGADHQISPYLQEINKAGDRATNLTRQLLAFGRKQILQPLAINLNSIVGDMIKLLTRLIGEDVHLVTKCGANIRQVLADPGQLEQVLVNLVVNARDAMPLGGTVTIETANATLDGAYASRHVGVIPGEYVMLAVSDTGTGIDPATQAHIFEPFFTTKEPGKGTGLGLSTVYGIIKQSGGNVWVYSELGKGTTFKVYLPQLDAEVQQATDLSPVDSSVRRGSETVLLVEDEEMVRNLVSELLKENGYRVLTASGGEEALQLFKEHKQIDLLVTDVVMPRMSGKDIADRLRVTHPKTKVLFMSGYTDEAIVHHGIVDSGVAFIQKPFSQAVLANKVRDVLDSANANRSQKRRLSKRILPPGK